MKKIITILCLLIVYVLLCVCSNVAKNPKENPKEKTYNILLYSGGELVQQWDNVTLDKWQIYSRY